MLTGVAEYTTPLACRFAADAAAHRRRRPDGAAGDGLQDRPARDDRSLPRRCAGHARCRSWSTTIPWRTASTSRRRCSPIWPMKTTLVAIKESSENVRRITDLTQCYRRPLHPVQRRRRPGSGSGPARGCRLGFGAGQRLSRGDAPVLGPGGQRQVRGSARDLPLVHAAAASRHQAKAGAVHQAGGGRVRPGIRDRALAAAADHRRRARRDFRHHSAGDRDAAGAGTAGVAGYRQSCWGNRAWFGQAGALPHCSRPGYRGAGLRPAQAARPAHARRRSTNVLTNYRPPLANARGSVPAPFP